MRSPLNTIRHFKILSGAPKGSLAVFTYYILTRS